MLYSEGAFKIDDFWLAPTYHLEEAIEAMSEKNEKLKQKLSKGNKKTF